MKLFDWRVRPRRTTRAYLTVLVIALTVAAVPGVAMAAPVFPNVIGLPDGFAPEGVASGRGTAFYAGSLAGGAIFMGDLRTGDGTVLVPAQPVMVALGMKVDARTNYLFVAGGFDGTGRVYDGASGALLETYPLALPAGSYVPLINDVVLTQTAAYFTDSCSGNLFKVPLMAGGRLPAPSAVEMLPLTGDFAFQFVPTTGIPCVPNANGIVATADGKWLIVVDTLGQQLFRVDPATGEALKIEVGGPVPNGDGLLLRGRTLYVVQNFSNQISEIRLSPDLLAGTIVGTLTSPDFRIPTTGAFFGSAIYAVNARFDTPVTPTTEYEVVRVSR